ncbi:MAG: hypothetical protein ACFFFG_04245 [Candidatus Thorarchaeota archaeon]
MDHRKRARKAKQIADKRTGERLRILNYSEDVLQAYELVNTSHSESVSTSTGIVLMDIAWQSGGSVPSEIELANAYFPIQCFFLGTIYQDDLLDSLKAKKPRFLVKTLGMPNCMIMGNILYCEALISLFEQVFKECGDKLLPSCDSMERMVKDIMESEIIRRHHIGKILPLRTFNGIWRRLTPFRACIEIGGIVGNSDKEKIKDLTEIASNLSISRRITKEISEIYGLRGSFKEKIRNKPSPLPITLAYQSATLSEKQEIELFLKRLDSRDWKNFPTKDSLLDIGLLIDVVAKYDSISAALEIQRGIIEETRGLLGKVANSEHRNILSQLLETQPHKDL